MEHKDIQGLVEWAEQLGDVAAKLELDPNKPLDAAIIDMLRQTGSGVAELTRDYDRLAEENELLRKKVKRLELKLFAIINMAADISKYAERAIHKTTSPDE